MNVAAVIPAAGLGTRMARATAETSRKQFLQLGGEAILVHTVRRFTECQSVGDVVACVRAEDLETVRELLAVAGLAERIRLVEGGRNRQESVHRGLESLPAGTEIVVVHDAVRPFVTVAQIEESIAVAAERGAAILGVPAVDTVKDVERNHVIKATIPRERIVLAQTPQTFRYELLMRAVEDAEAAGFQGTDEASLVERLGEEVRVLMGSPRNIKITRPDDMALAELYFSADTQS